MPYNEQVKQIQALLVGKWGAKIDVDGLAGPATYRAIYNALMSARPKVSVDTPPPAADKVDPAGTPAEPIPVLLNVPHYSQGAPLVRGILLGFPLTEQQKAENIALMKEERPPKYKEPDTCQKSGCLSTALWCCLAAQRGDDFPAVDSFIEHLVSCECYLNGSILHQGKACAEFGFRYQRQISAYAAKNYLRDGYPIIIQIRKPHTHFLVGLGYDAVKGYAVHDPGTRDGNFYKGERWLNESDVTRFDVASPK